MDFIRKEVNDAKTIFLEAKWKIISIRANCLKTLVNIMTYENNKFIAH